MGNSNSRNGPQPRGETLATGLPVVQGTEVMKPEGTEEQREGKTQALDLTFTMDCTGSMGAYISAAKSNIEAIAERLVEKENFDLRFSLVAYRDHPPQDQTFVTKCFPFTNDVATMKSNLRTLCAQGGGDGPEAVAAALKATHDQAWRPHATKICVLIADAPPHGLGEAGDGFPDGAPDGVDPLQVLDQMSMQGICIYSVGCEPALSHYQFAKGFFIAAAERTNGQAVALGSANMLADVIMGGAIEEMDLEKLSMEVQQQVRQLQAVEPELAENEVQQRVWRGLQARSAKTRTLRSAKLRSDSSGVISKANTLEEAQVALRACPSSAFKARAKSHIFSKSHTFSARRSLSIEDCESSIPDADEDCESSTPDASMDAVVALEDAAVSLSQVARVYGKCKSQGLI